MLSSVHRDICLYPYCLNIRYKLSCLNRVIIEKQLDNPDFSLNRLKINGELRLRGMMLCQREEASKWHDPKCIEGKCLKCWTNGEETTGIQPQKSHMESLGTKRISIMMVKLVELW